MQVTSGLTSSLLLAVGLTRLAEKTDPLLKMDPAALVRVPQAQSSEFCTYPCSFTPYRGV